MLLNHSLLAAKYDCFTKKAMNSRSSSISIPAPRLQQRSSFPNRLSLAISTAEQGEAEPAPTVAEHQIDEEIEKIKRYEVGAYKTMFCLMIRVANICIGLHNDRYCLHEL